MENPINITFLNDFIFCPVSIYFHGLYSDVERGLYQSEFQIDGTNAHKNVDNKKYSTSAHIYQSLDVYCEKYNLVGKIDIYDSKKCVLIERKKKVNKIYDGYVFQLYAQYFSLIEMGYVINKLLIHSIDDNKNYEVKLPEQDKKMFEKFVRVIDEINRFRMDSFTQDNSSKCQNCIYEPYCDRGSSK